MHIGLFAPLGSPSATGEFVTTLDGLATHIEAVAD